jgi:uncharacterized protein YajQ (UPF0234 family)
MASYSFDVVSEFDKAEMNNVFDQANREILNRYDFKNTPAGLDWDGDKIGLVITGNSELQIESIIEIVRKKIASRGLDQKVLDTREEISVNNFKSTKVIPFVQGLDKDKSRRITVTLRDNLPKIKCVIQGETVRVSSNSKDELQSAITLLRATDFDFPLRFINYR